MAPKRKEEAPKQEDAEAAKKAKTEEGAEKKDVDMKEDEEEKEKEKDDKKDSRPIIKESVRFETADTTLNVLPAYDGRALMSMCDGGMQFLAAGARGNVGIKSGRYFFEVKVLEALTLYEGDYKAQVGPKQMVRIGFSAEKSSLILGESAGGVCFDATGAYTYSTETGAIPKRVTCSQQFGKDQVIGCLLNLDQKSPNANTISMFRNGTRISEPQELPELLKGKVLYPHVAFRSVSLQVNFGKEALCPLPFKCKMIGEAASADVKENRHVAPKNGKYDVLFPVGFPDEGTFEWLDTFLDKHPQYLELSDRMIHDWIQKSGPMKCRNRGSISNDKPPFNYGIKFVDDDSIRRAVRSVAPLVPRNYVVMEVKQNLVAADRSENLQRFNLPHFKRIAQVVMGEPKKDFKDKVHEKLLEQKQLVEDDAWKQRKVEHERKKAEKARKKLVEQKRKEMVEAQKKIAEENKRKREEAEAKKNAEAEAKKNEEGEAAKEGAGSENTEEKKGESKTEEKADVEMATEEKKDDKADEKAEDAKAEDEKKEEEKKTEEAEKKEEEEEEDEEMEDEPPKAELTEEEKKTNFIKPAHWKDLLDSVLNSSFGQFSIPEKAEGFDEVKYEWDDAGKSKQYLKTWVLDRKLTSRMDDLKPGEWFTTTLAEFSKVADEYQNKQKAFAQKAPKDLTGDADKKKEEEDDSEIKEDVDIFTVKDVCDIGDGEPLFANFSFEDWSLFKLRFELYLLMAAFKKDAQDPERVGIHESLFTFYYSRYFNKAISPRAYGKETLQQVIDLVKDTAGFDSSNGVLICKFPEDAEKEVADFAKLQEENRRERQRRIDAGDETVRLNFDVLRQQNEQQSRTEAMNAARAEAQKRQGVDRGTYAQARVTIPPATGSSAFIPAPRQVVVQPPRAGGKGGPAVWNTDQKSWNNDQKSAWTGGDNKNWDSKQDREENKANGGNQSWEYAPRTFGKGGGKGKW